MTSPEHERVTADETATERHYNKALLQRAKEAQQYTRANVNNSWTTSGSMEAPRVGELVGRIALSAESATIDGEQNFYIGTTKHEGDGYQVFSWTAPIAACTYYRQPPDRNHLHELSESVAGVRVFARDYSGIVDFQDEVIGDYPVDSLFPKRRLQIPRAPGSRQQTEVTRSPAADMSERLRANPGTGVQPQSDTVLGSSTSQAPDQVIPGPKLRAPDLLRRQLAAPKAASMSAVLATLQPDQYAAITKSAAESQFLQGHPGTGKTIIAVHRAAYLLNSETPKKVRSKGHVLILGPTEEYCSHIRAALRKLIVNDDAYVVKSIPDLLEELAGLPQSTVPTLTMAYSDVDSDLARLVDVAYRKAKSSLDGTQRPDRDSTYAELVGLLQDPPESGLEAEWVAYLRGVPATFDELKKQRARHFRGLMAYIGVLVDRAESNPGHVIVDEAQDIHPIEWEVLGRLGNRGGWSILGDLNQRRTDHTFTTWDHVAHLLAIEDSQGHAPVQMLERGYRSTAQIIQFANQLLPARERVLYSLQQDGEAPTLARVLVATELAYETVAAAEGLSERFTRGTVAVIAVDVMKVSGAISRRGWSKKGADPFVWKKGEKEIRILPPERARGLEFDGVVVMEPADFPENAGRKGVLYTALTRANRALVIVHNRALPRAIKPKA